MAKFKIDGLSTAQNTYQAPLSSYTFRRGEWLEVTNKEDIAFFKAKRQFDMKTVKSVVTNALKGKGKDKNKDTAVESVETK